MTTLSLQDQVAIVTGAGKGIGAALVAMLADEGVKVMMTARTAADLHAVQRDVLAKHPTAQLMVFPADVSDAEAVHSLVHATLDLWGRVDIVVNNAGVAPKFQLFQELSVSDIDKTIDINLKGPMYLMKAVLPHMIHQGEGGTIVNINSIAGSIPFAYSSVYCASKFGLKALTQCVADEQRMNNIKVLGIYPGEVHTPLQYQLRDHDTPDYSKMLDPENVAEAVRYALKQPDKSFVRDIVIESLLPSSVH